MASDGLGQVFVHLCMFGLSWAQNRFPLKCVDKRWLPCHPWFLLGSRALAVTSWNLRAMALLPGGCPLAGVLSEAWACLLFQNCPREAHGGSPVLWKDVPSWLHPFILHCCSRARVSPRIGADAFQVTRDLVASDPSLKDRNWPFPLLLLGYHWPKSWVNKLALKLVGCLGSVANFILPGIVRTGRGKKSKLRYHGQKVRPWGYW